MYNNIIIKLRIVGCGVSISATKCCCIDLFLLST